MKNINYKYFAISLLLLIICWLVRDAFYKFCGNLVFGANLDLDELDSFAHRILPPAIFVISVGILPFLFFLVTVIRRISLQNEILKAGVIIVGSGLLFLGLRIYYLRFQIAALNDLMQRAELVVGSEFRRITIEEMYLEIYLFAGFIFGTLLSLIIFRKNNIMSRK